MNKLNELKATAEKLNAQIAELEEAEKPWPQVGKECFVIYADTTINDILYNVQWEKELKQGRVFRTKEEAVWARNWYEKNAKKMHVLYELEQWAKDFNGDWVAEWTSSTQLKWCLEYHYGRKKIKLIGCHHVQFNTLPVLKTACKNELLAHFGDRLNILFDVK